MNAGGGSDDDITAGSAASNSSAEGAGDDIDSTGASASERKAEQHSQPPVPVPAGAKAGMAGRMEGGLGRKATKEGGKARGDGRLER